MNILEIYNNYQIMPQLQQHQLRVAGVAFSICQELGSKVSTKDVLTACLLHDMGNILKFDLESELIPGQFEPQGKYFWQMVKGIYKEKYGPDEHTATSAITKEIGASEKVISLINSIGFFQAIENSESENLEVKICSYSDMRVDPWGVVSLEERLKDLRKRYQENRQQEDLNKTLEFESALRIIEKQLFTGLELKPENITEPALQTQIEKLKEWEV